MWLQRTKNKVRLYFLTPNHTNNQSEIQNNTSNAFWDKMQKKECLQRQILPKKCQHYRQEPMLQETIACALVDPTQVYTPEMDGYQALKHKLNESVSPSYYFFECTLEDTLTAKNGDAWS